MIIVEGQTLREGFEMGIFDYLFGPRDKEPDDAQPPPSWAGKGPDIDEGREMTQTEKDLRRVQSQYDPETQSFDSKRR